MSSTAFRYPGSAPLGLQYSESVSKALKGRLPKDAFGIRLYDTLRFKPGVATPTSVLRMFTSGLGQNGFVANQPAEQFSKTFFDTNLIGGNQLPANEAIVVQSVQALVNVSAATDTTYPTSGAGTELPTDTTAAAAVAAANLTQAILNQASLVITVGSKEYEGGPLILFPSRYGISGYAGFGVSTNFEGVTNNGFGREWELPVERLIPPLVNFGVNIQFVQALTISRQFTIRIVLEGILYRAVQ